MQKIKFRGKRTDGNNNWTYGSLVTDGENYFIIPSFKIGYNKTLEPVVQPVIPETVGQYIDDDKDDKEIYEDDIIQGTIEQTFEDRQCRGVVEIKQMSTMVDFPNEGVSIEMALLDEDNIEKIGNTHDNPELLK